MTDLAQLSLNTTTRLAVTVAIVISILAVRFIVRRYRERRGGDLGAVQRLVLSTAIAGTTALGVLGMLGVWELSGALYDAYGNLDLAGQVPEIVLAIVILGGAYALTDFVGQVIREIVSAGDSVSDHQQEVIYRLTQLTIYAVAFLVVVGLFTENLGSLLVGAGFLGIVVGMAARQTLGAVLAGIVLMFSRPFEIGDWVEVGEYEGVVTDITIVNTRIRTFDGEHVTIPNDVIGGNPVLDRTKEDRLRIEVEVGVDYEDDPERAAEVAVEAVEGVDNVLQMPSPQVVGKRFADSAVVLGVRYWIDNPSSRKRWRTRTGVIAAVHEAFAEEGITIPFPQRTHSAREGGVGVRLDDADDRGRGEEASDGGGDR
ncbi:mechanosensitive ion channel family protein [Haloparvum alkalitolerans]|uniref:mechanosensitive ion channel family protein n=1 Tax=Haloparvum alkalitolerans TaxID=1042953 RepID=UPI003CEB9603